MQSIKVTFKNSNNISLAGILDLPENPTSFALYSHCFTCSKDMVTPHYICKTLAQNNIATLRFDFTGLGNSDGDFSETDFTSNVDDILAAASFLNTHHQAPSLLIGHSFGGTATLAAAGKLESSRAVVTIASPHRPSHVLIHFKEAVEILKENARTNITINDREFTIKKEFITDLHRYEEAEYIGNLNKPVLILHSPSDNVVAIQEATNIFTMANHPKSFISLGDMDHMLSNKEDAEYVANLIFAWATKHINH